MRKVKDETKKKKKINHYREISTNLLQGMILLNQFTQKKNLNHASFLYRSILEKFKQTKPNQKQNERLRKMKTDSNKIQKSHEEEILENKGGIFHLNERRQKSKESSVKRYEYYSPNQKYEVNIFKDPHEERYSDPYFLRQFPQRRVEDINPLFLFSEDEDDRKKRHLKRTLKK